MFSLAIIRFLYSDLYEKLLALYPCPQPQPQKDFRFFQDEMRNLDREEIAYSFTIMQKNSTCQESNINIKENNQES